MTVVKGFRALHGQSLKMSHWVDGHFGHFFTFSRCFYKKSSAAYMIMAQIYFKLKSLLPAVFVSVRSEDATGSSDVFRVAQFQLLPNRGWQRSPIIHFKTRGAEQTSKVYEDFPGGEMWGRRALQEATREAEVQQSDHDLSCTSRSNNILLQPPNTCLCHLYPPLSFQSVLHDGLKLFGLSGISVWDSPWEQAAPNTNFHNCRPISWLSALTQAPCFDFTRSEWWPWVCYCKVNDILIKDWSRFLQFQVPRRRLLEDKLSLPCIKTVLQW